MRPLDVDFDIESPGDAFSQLPAAKLKRDPFGVASPEWVCSYIPCFDCCGAIAAAVHFPCPAECFSREVWLRRGFSYCFRVYQLAHF